MEAATVCAAAGSAGMILRNCERKNDFTSFGLVRSVARFCGPHGIRANAITPGYIRTPGTEAMYADPEIYEGRRKGVPMGRVGAGEDIAGPAIFLASEDARYTTGSVVGADGGQAVGYFLSVPGRRFSGGRID